MVSSTLDSSKPQSTALVELLSTRLNEAFTFTPERAAVWLALARTLATGTPAPLPEGLENLPNTEWSGDRVAGSLITTIPTDHIITHSGGCAWTWCIVDAIVAGLILPGGVQVDTLCRTTGRALRFQVDLAGIHDAPSDLVITVPSRFTPGADLRADFCCKARAWTQMGDGDDVAWLTPAGAHALTVGVARRLNLVGACVPR